MKKKKPRSFANRLTWKLIQVITITNIIIIGAVLFFVFAVAATQSTVHYTDLIKYTGDKLEAKLASIELSASLKASELTEKLNSPDAVYSILEREVEQSTFVRGCGIGFQPDFYPSKGRWFEPYVARRNNGKMERLQIGSDKHDYFQSEWFQKGMKADCGYWTNPYFDKEGANSMLCTYVLPIRNQDGQTVAVLGTDLSLQWIENQVRTIELTENDSIFDDDEDYEVSCFIISNEGKYIVKPLTKGKYSDSYLTDVNETPDTIDNFICHQMMQGKQGMKRANINGKKTFVFYSPLGQTGWSMCIVVPSIGVYIWGIFATIGVLILLMLGGLIIFFMSRNIIHKLAKPLRFLSQSAGEVAKGNFDTPLPVFKHNDEISQLRDSFDTMQQSLAKYVDELKSTTAAKAAFESELRIAHDIQMSMLPKTFPAFPERDDIEVYGRLAPAKAVGGDLYDFFIRDEKLFFCIGDVAGKGVPAALVMATTRSLFRSIASHTAKPSHIVEAINNLLSENNDNNMFVTIFVGVLDLPTGRLRYANAGHNPPIIIQTNDHDEILSSLLSTPNSQLSVLNSQFEPTAHTSDLPVGIIPQYKYEEHEIILHPSSIIFLYTDGLTEAEDASHTLFGIERTMNVINTFHLKPLNLPSQTSKPLTPSSIIDAMTQAVQQFVGDTEQSDDLTMLAIQYSRQKSDIIIQRSLTLQNDIQEVPQLAEFVDELCEAIGIDMATSMQLNLAIEEAVVNVMNYAYPKDEQGEVRILAEANNKRIKFIISDDGKPFDPTAHGEVDTTLTADERDIGGLGIHLVRKIMDSINYERTQNQNVFTLRKNLKQERETTEQ